MTVMADGICEDPPLSGAPPSSPSPLDLRRGDGAPPRLPFSISSLLSSSLSSQLSASRDLLGRAAADRELLDREKDLMEREKLMVKERELMVRGDLQEHSESEGEHDGEVNGEDDEEVRDESNGEEEEDDHSRSFQPYSYTHMPFAAGLLPHLHGLLPSLGGLGAHGLGGNPNLMSGPGGVIRVPAHRPPLNSSVVNPISGASLPWLAGLTPLERTAAMAHHLSSLAPMAGRAPMIWVLKNITSLLGLWHKHLSCPNASTFLGFGYDWYFVLSLLKKIIYNLHFSQPYSYN